MEVLKIWFEPPGPWATQTAGIKAWVTLDCTGVTEIPSQKGETIRIPMAVRIRSVVLREAADGAVSIEIPPIPVQGVPRTIIEFNTDFVDRYLCKVVSLAWQRVLKLTHDRPEPGRTYLVERGKDPQIKAGVGL